MGAPSPAMAALMPLLMQRMEAMGGPGPGPGGDGTGPASTPADIAASAGYGRELNNARQANPAALAQAIHEVKMKIGEILNATLASNPGVARALSKTLQGLDAAIKEATSAASTLQVAQPINASAAQGAPGAGGSNPAPISVPGIGGQY